MRADIRSNLKKAEWAGILSAWLLLAFVLSAGLVYAEETTEKNSEDVFSSDSGTVPALKEGDPAKRICVVSYDEYIPFSRQLYYILTGLEENGWIAEGSIPFTAEEIEKMYVDEMYALLEETDLGPYLEFSPGL